MWTNIVFCKYANDDPNFPGLPYVEFTGNRAEKSKQLSLHLIRTGLMESASHITRMTNCPCTRCYRPFANYAIPIRSLFFVMPPRKIFLSSSSAAIWCTDSMQEEELERILLAS